MYQKCTRFIHQQIFMNWLQQIDRKRRNYRHCNGNYSGRERLKDYNRVHSSASPVFIHRLMIESDDGYDQSRDEQEDDEDQESPSYISWSGHAWIQLLWDQQWRLLGWLPHDVTWFLSSKRSTLSGRVWNINCQFMLFCVWLTWSFFFDGHCSKKKDKRRPSFRIKSEFPVRDLLSKKGQPSVDLQVKSLLSNWIEYLKDKNNAERAKIPNTFLHQFFIIIFFSLKSQAWDKISTASSRR